MRQLTARSGRLDVRLMLPALASWVCVGILLGEPHWLGVAATACWALGLAVGGLALLRTRKSVGADSETDSVAGSGAASGAGSGTGTSTGTSTVFATILLVAVVTALILSSAAIQSASRMPESLVNAARSNRTISATAMLSSTVLPDTAPESASGPLPGHAPIPITLLSVTVGSTELAGISIPALLFGELPECTAPRSKRCSLGAVIRFTANLSRADPGDRVAFLAFARGSPRIATEPAWFLRWANFLRAGFTDVSGTLPGDGGQLLPGLAIGDTSRVNSTLDASMKATSLSHLTAVSGANCAVIIGLILMIGTGLGMKRAWRVGLALLALVGFVVLVTPSASVLRAAVMATVVLCSMSAGRPTRGVPVLCLATIVLLGVDPWMSRDFGFILSVLATGGILLLCGPLSRLLARWIPAQIAIAIALPLSAQLACQPVLILLNPSVPVYGIVANLLSEPAAPFATILGLLSCLTLPMAAPLGHLLAFAAWVPSAWIAAVARFFAGLPGAQAPWLPGAIGVVLMALTIGVVLLAVLGGHSGSSFQRPLASGLLAFILIGYLGVVAGSGVGRFIARPSNWQIAVCDVGQGDAVFVRSVDQVALIDTGPRPEPLAECLTDLGIARVQLLVLTHYDLDHVGGVEAILGRAERVLVGPISDGNDLRLRESLQLAGAEVDEGYRGQQGRLGDLSWKVLWPPPQLGSVEPGNPASVTLRFDGTGACQNGCLSSIFLGDLGEQSQLRLLGSHYTRAVDIVKVAHHGSSDQSEQLYRRLAAKVGIIGVGIGNDYGHPTDKLLDLLGSVGTTICRTDLEGMILLSPRPDGAVSVWTQRVPERDVGAH